MFVDDVLCDPIVGRYRSACPQTLPQILPRTVRLVSETLKYDWGQSQLLHCLKKFGLCLIAVTKIEHYE